MKTHSIAILSALLLPYFFSLMGVSLSCFFFNHSSFQQEVKYSEKKNVILVFTAEEFQHIEWTKKNTEFVKAGKMYDVTAITSHRGIVEIHCQNDQFEEMLLSYVKLFGGKEKSDFMPNVQFFEPLIEYHTAFFILPFILPNEQIDLYKSRIVDFNTPPPQFFS